MLKLSNCGKEKEKAITLKRKEKQKSFCADELDLMPSATWPWAHSLRPCKPSRTGIQWCWRQASAVNPLGFSRIHTRQNMSFSRTNTGPRLISSLSPHHTQADCSAHKGRKALGLIDGIFRILNEITSVQGTQACGRGQGGSWCNTGINMRILSPRGHHRLRPVASWYYDVPLS